jgi:hypothetical protein
MKLYQKQQLIREHRVKRKSVKRTWILNHPTALCFYWERNTYDRMLNRSLDADDEFIEWCYQNYIQVHHEWVECPDEATMTLFVLKWM